MYTVKAFNACIARFCVLSWSVILLSHLPPELIHITAFGRSNVTISLGSGHDPISFKFSTGHWGWGESPGISEVLAIVYSYHHIFQQTGVAGLLVTCQRNQKCWQILSCLLNWTGVHYHLLCSVEGTSWEKKIYLRLEITVLEVVQLSFIIPLDI